MAAGPTLRSVASVPESIDEAAATATGAERAFATTEGVAVSGPRAIDRAASYEKGVRNLYDELPYNLRRYRDFVDGEWVNGVADTTTLVDGRSAAVDAKYVDSWMESLRNPKSQFGNQPWAVNEQENMLRQAKAYTSGFPGGVVYHTNSIDLATFYTDFFKIYGVSNFKFIITPVTQLNKYMNMNRTYMEQILGVTFERERKIPGTRPGEGDTVRYISFTDPVTVPELFDTTVSKVEPPLIRGGGAILEGTRLKLPDGEQFFAVTFHGDEAWPMQIEQGASLLGRKTAKVLGGDIVTSDGRLFPLSECEIEFG